MVAPSSKHTNSERAQAGGASRLPTLHGRPLIFESTLSGSLTQQATTLSLSAFLWALWLTLWAPVVTALGWALGPLWGASVVLSGHAQSLPTIALLTAIGFALATFLILAGAVQWGFGAARPRPRPTLSVTAEQLALAHQMAPDELVKLWGSQRIVLHHDANGRIAHTESS